MSATLVERMDHLFRNQLNRRGREYTYREVTADVTGQGGTTFSPAYPWQLHTGAKDNPTIRHLEALARFFLVSPSYFFDDELTGFPDTEVRLLVASRTTRSCARWRSPCWGRTAATRRSRRRRRGSSSGCSEGRRGLGALAWLDVHSPQVEERIAGLCR